jgi:hypothetical protein
MALRGYSIHGYSIHGSSWLLYPWLFMIILLVDIGGYSINGFW